MANDNNQAAPAPAADNAATTVASESTHVDALASKSGDSKVAVKTEGTTNKTETSEPSFDPQTSYSQLVKNLETVNKSYGDLRREFTRRTQYEADLKKQIETLSKAFAEATKEEVSPEEFIKSLQTQGVKAFDPLRQQWQEEIKGTYDKALSERDSQISALQTQFEVMKRELDTKNYPDFAELKTVMHELAESENCPVDFSQPVGVIYDTLYKLAKDRNSENAIQKARELGRKEADAQAAKEAGSAVATGGKAGVITDPRQIKDINKLREYFVSQLGEAD